MLDGVQCPIRICEEGMCLDRGHTIAAQSVLGFGQKFADDVLCIVGNFDIGGELQLSVVVHDARVCVDQRVRIKGHLPDEHFIEENAHGPPVHFSTVHPLAALGTQHFRADVVGSADSAGTMHKAILNREKRIN